MKYTNQKSRLFRRFTNKLLIFALTAVFLTTSAVAQTTLFKFEGRLANNVVPPVGTFQMEFRLFDAAEGGSQLGATNAVNQVEVRDRQYTVWLDFGAEAFADGGERYLEVSIRRHANQNFTTLEPRYLITSVPYAIRSLTAGTADTATNAENATNSTNAINAQNADNATNAINAQNATMATTANNALQLGGISADQYVTGQVVRNLNGLSNNITLAAGANISITPSGNTLTIASTDGGILNQTTRQTGANFNIDGTGTANIFNAATQFNIGGNRILSAAGTNNILAGFNAGAANIGFNNTFVGANAGRSNTGGSGNSFFGFLAGELNLTGNNNSFFGEEAGRSNTTGNNNSFFGEEAGESNTEGGSNSFFGEEAGDSNTTGNSNSFFGRDSGNFNTTGNGNSFFGRFAGSFNRTGSENTVIGYFADLSEDNFTNAAAFGARSRVDCSNCLVLGSVSGINDAASSVNVGIGTTNPQARLDIFGGNVALNNNMLRLSGASDANHGIVYDAGIDGIGSRAFGGFRWHNFQFGENLRMQLDNLGNLQIDGSFGQLSDARLKTNVETVGASALGIVGRLRGVRFDWKPETGNGTRRQIGFIAQEVEQVLPELVSTDDDGTKSVAYASAVPVLVEAIKEQQKQIELQQLLIDGLRKLVCQTNPQAAVCKQ
jgi:hypothetical protein